MITGQSRRQRAGEIMAQAVREIHAVFPQFQVDVFDTGPEREDGLLIVHVPEPDMVDEVYTVVGKLLTDAMLNEDLLIVLGSTRSEAEIDDCVALERPAKDVQVAACKGVTAW